MASWSFPGRPTPQDICCPPDQHEVTAARPASHGVQHALAERCVVQGPVLWSSAQVAAGMGAKPGLRFSLYQPECQLHAPSTHLLPVETAASTALPPSRSTSRPAWHRITETSGRMRGQASSRQW